jgi:ferredoxin
MVKLSQNVTNLGDVALAAERAGASAISAIDSIRCILSVDIERRVPCLSTYGGYSGSAIRPLGLAAVAAIAQSVRIPTCGIGGICGCRDMLEYFMLGASFVQIGSALMMNGFSLLGALRDELCAWMDEHHVRDLPEIVGSALPALRAYDDIPHEPLTASLSQTCERDDCGRCAACCIYDAITDDAGISIDKDACAGCGLCVDICPDHKIALRW